MQRDLVRERLEKIEKCKPIYFKDESGDFNDWVYRGLHDRMLDGWLILGRYLHSIDIEDVKENDESITSPI